jgi:hypothetical protein
LAGREIDQTFGRYMIDGSGTKGIGGVGGHSGGKLLYFHRKAAPSVLLDPGYATIPYSTAATNPGLVNHDNFASGMIAADPVAGGMTNLHLLNTLWAQAGVPNNTQRFSRTPEFFQDQGKNDVGVLMAVAGHRSLPPDAGVWWHPSHRGNAQQAPFRPGTVRPRNGVIQTIFQSRNRGTMLTCCLRSTSR